MNPMTTIKIAALPLLILATVVEDARANENAVVRLSISDDSANTIVTLINRSWKPGVQVQVVVGRAYSCDDNAVYGTQWVLIDSKWSIRPGAGNDVCFRRQSIPGDSSSGWSDWTRVSNFGHNVETTIQ